MLVVISLMRGPMPLILHLEELKEAVALCHQHGVRLFVTVNTLYQDKDFVELYDYICALYEMQIDALIVQDEGLMDVLKENFPDFEVHASTQCTIPFPGWSKLLYAKRG